jgi:hypothetical protein
LDAAEYAALAAKQFHETWDFYKRERRALIAVMRRFEDFFVREIQAQYYSFVVTIYLLQDKRSGVRLTDLIAELRPKLNAQSQIDLLNEAEAMLRKWSATENKFCELRNNVVAHMNRSEPPSVFYKKLGLRYDEMSDYSSAMLSVAQMLLDAYESPAFLAAFGRRSYTGKASPVPDLRRLFDALQPRRAKPKSKARNTSAARK